MKYFLEFKEEFKQNIVDAPVWYRDKAGGLDIRFLNAIEGTVKRIQNSPNAGIKIYKNYRQPSVKKFPYVIVYEIILDSVIFYQAFHTSQNPKKKIKRLK